MTISKEDLTPAQQQEMVRGNIKYLKSYVKWLDMMKAARFRYSTVGKMLEDLYRTRTVHDIARLLNTTGMSVCNMMRRLGVSRRNRPEKDSTSWYGYGREA